jgi:Tfp pilus assembly protein PilV
MGTNRLNVQVSGRGEQGASILEVLVAALVLSVAVLSMLYFLVLAVRTHEAAGTRWSNSVERWNETRNIRSCVNPDGEMLYPVPGNRPLRRTVPDLQGAGEDQSWEVISDVCR